MTNYYLCVVCTHGPIAVHGAPGVAEARVGEDIVIHFIIPWLDELQNGAKTVKKRSVTVYVRDMI